MKLALTLSTIPALLLAAPVASGQWIAIANPDTYNLGENDPLLAEGWVFQDGDYFAYPQCQDGTNDCTGYRAVVEAPYNPAQGSSKAIEILPGDPTETFVANSRFHTAKALPQEIPVGGKATVFVHFAIEDVSAQRYFALSDRVFEPIGPIVEPGGEMPLGWDQHGPIFMINREHQMRVFETNGGGYVPAREVAGDPDAGIAGSGEWYSLWMQVSNDAQVQPADIGGHYELYIAGGKFGDEPVHITNTVPEFIDAGITAWTFRRNAGEPIRTFNVICHYGNPASNTFGFGGTWINAVYMLPDVHTLETPFGDAPAGETWADWSDDTVDNWVDTGDFLGWIYFDGTGWIYAQNSDSWFYLPEDFVQPSGAWSHIPRF